MLRSLASSILPLMLLIIFTYGLYKKVSIYEEFVEGAKDGFKIAVSIIPYLVALIVGISMFKACGVIDIIKGVFCGYLEKFNLTTDILPIMITRSLSGSATLGLFSELATEHGGNAFITKLAAVMVGSSETTFYVLSVYFGAVGVKKFRYAILTGLTADIIGILLAILVSRWFFLANIV